MSRSSLALFLPTPEGSPIIRCSVSLSWVAIMPLSGVVREKSKDRNALTWGPGGGCTYSHFLHDLYLLISPLSTVSNEDHYSRGIDNVDLAMERARIDLQFHTARRTPRLPPRVPRGREHFSMSVRPGKSVLGAGIREVRAFWPLRFLK